MRLRRRDLLALPFALSAQDPVERPSPPLELKAGPLSLVFEPGLGFVRYIKFGEHEVLRGIYAAVRDKSWGTVPPQVSNLKTVTTPEGFQLDFDVVCQEREIDFAWHGTVTGEASGRLKFDFAGQARSDFERNRIGFCVLHPLTECAGKPCRAETADGKTTMGTFPDLIAPHQPLLNLKAVSHKLPDGTDVEVRFTGDTFEMEDHRNWTDGNYKTYCTPLALPFPVKVAKGTRVAQSISVKVTPARAPAAPRSRSVVELTETTRTGRLPSVGFGVALQEKPLQDASLLSLLKPAHLRVDLRADSQWRGPLTRAKQEAALLRTQLEVAIHLAGNPEAVLKAIAQENLNAARYLIYKNDETATRPETIALARKILKGNITSGTNQYFTELNRERPALDHLDGVCYSLNPQVHAFDNASLVENLSPQGDTVRSARQFCGTKPIVVTPVTLRPRFNPQQRGPEPPQDPNKLPARIDHRQPSLFAAAWTLGSLKYLSESGAASVTYYETHGWGGLLLAGPSPNDRLFKAKPNAVFPSYHVFADFADFAGGTWQALETDSPLEAIGLTLTLGKRKRTIIANLTAGPRIVRAPAGRQSTLRTLDDRSYNLATSNPAQFRKAQQTLTTGESTVELPLGPYALVTLDTSI
jgi:hypothetical protein